MKSYEIIGLRNKNQAQAIYDRFVDVLGDSSLVEIDLEHGHLKLADEVDPYIISLVSSFEQVTIIDYKKLEEFTEKEEKSDHGHDHHHELGEGQSAEKRILVVFLLNLFFSVSEFIFGTLFKSQAILSDAVHDLGDALSIGLAYFFEKISSRESSAEYSYGYRRFSLLGGLVTSVVLLGGALIMIITTIPELLNPSPVNHRGVFYMAIAAIIINGFSVKLMSGGDSSNEKLLNIHLFEDLFGWILVLVMSIILRYTDWYILDPILSLAIASWILYVTFPEFIRISKIFLQAVPGEIDTKALYHKIMDLNGVEMISHFHIWSTDGEQHMMSLTVTTDLKTNREQDQIKQKIRELVVNEKISHITIEILYDPEQLIREA